MFRVPADHVACRVCHQVRVFFWNPPPYNEDSIFGYVLGLFHGKLHAEVRKGVRGSCSTWVGVDQAREKNSTRAQTLRACHPGPTD